MGKLLDPKEKWENYSLNFRTEAERDNYHAIQDYSKNTSRAKGVEFLSSCELINRAIELYVNKFKLKSK